MATLVFAAAGAAIGGSIGGSILGISAAAIGQGVGALIGRSIDQALFSTSQTIKTAGPRLDNIDVQTASEGVGLPVVEGRGRIAGQVIWATRISEVTKTTRSSQGGKGGGGGTTVETTEYHYYANFAVALTDCSTGAIRHFGRIWADGKILDTSGLTVRYYNGSETQTADPLIVAKDGAAPAYRGMSYVVFDNLPVNDYGRRIPNLTFEVWGPSGEMEELIRGVDMIPAATEFGYSPTVVSEQSSGGSTTRVNAVRDSKTSDWQASLDLMQGVLPQCEAVALVVSWFGTDLRANHCEIEPRVEYGSKSIKGRSWSASGLSRSQANVVSQVEGSPALGSSPDDQSIIDAIKNLKERGLRVVLYPFIMMDIPDDNSLPDPDSGTIGQPAYPWRGRIRPELSGGAFESQISDFLGSAAPSHFSAGSGVPAYSGPSEWSYRRFILHLAALARNAGGVDAFLIGSELVSLTTATDVPAAYPFVDGLVALAGDVKSLLPDAQVSYAADWSEYHSHRTGAEVYFHLDPLWSSSDVDFIGIDNYLPISDWRSGTSHEDYQPDIDQTSVYSLDYLKSQIEGGEYWDYYYASDEDRNTQTRTPIFDGGHGEHWVYRQKAIRDWWGNAHHNRPGGVRSGTSTVWVASSKPVWFTEFGCPAVNLGSNQPNVFYDELSSEAALPHYSTGARDDFMQRQYVRAMLEWWRDNGGAIVNTANMFVWSWDSRPWPEFPRLTDWWSDGYNWRRGHWLNGRAGNIPVGEAIKRRLESYYGYDASQYDLSACFGQADGLILPNPLSFRSMLDTWQAALQLDASEFGGVLKVSSRAAAKPVADYAMDDLVEVENSPLYSITRAAQEETPHSAIVRYSDSDKDYELGIARDAIKVDPGEAEFEMDLSLVSDLDRMTDAVRWILRSADDSREAAEFILPPSSDLKPGEVFTLTPRDGAPIRFIADSVTRGDARKIKASLYSGTVFAAVGGPARATPARIVPPSDVAIPYFLDLPLLPGFSDMEDHQGIALFHSDPWPGGVDLYRSTDADTGYSLNLRTGLSGTVGETLNEFRPGVCSLWSHQTLQVKLYSGAFVSQSEKDVFAGANVLAIEHEPDQWEVIQFQEAELIGTDTWRLSKFLRGQLGTEWVRGDDPLPSGARIVALDSGIIPVDMSSSDIGKEFHFRSVPTGRDSADAETVTHTFNGMARRPLSPVHVKASVSGGLLSATWIRRTRVDGDDWSDTIADVPLGEAYERYLVEVGPSEDPVISVEVESAEISDLDVSALSGDQELRISQISETYGPGTAAITSISI